MALLGLRNFAVRLAVAVLTASVVHADADASVMDEYQVKAAFLYNFTKFVEWPPDLFESSDSPFGVCVLGQNLFGHALHEAARGKTVNGRMVVVYGIPDARAASRCQILFVSASERKRFGAILGELRTGGVLTVGETEGFIEAGGIINLKLDGGKIQIQININAAEQAGLRISSKLLSLAQIIRKPAQVK
jgi:uncharacterized protein DUF4154